MNHIIGSSSHFHGARSFSDPDQFDLGGCRQGCWKRGRIECDYFRVGLLWCILLRPPDFSGLIPIVFFIIILLGFLAFLGDFHSISFLKLPCVRLSLILSCLQRMLSLGTSARPTKGQWSLIIFLNWAFGCFFYFKSD